MSSFLGIEIEHNWKDITIHLDAYIQLNETLDEYKVAIT